jgi:hypothetical protein
LGQTAAAELIAAAAPFELVKGLEARDSKSRASYPLRLNKLFLFQPILSFAATRHCALNPDNATRPRKLPVQLVRQAKLERQRTKPSRKLAPAASWPHCVWQP